MMTSHFIYSRLPPRLKREDNFDVFDRTVESIAAINEAEKYLPTGPKRLAINPNEIATWISYPAGTELRVCFQHSSECM